MIKADRELLARLGYVNQKLGSINQSVGELCLRTLARQDDGQITADDLRTLGYLLVSLAGELTTLGVEMTQEADDRDVKIG